MAKRIKKTRCSAKDFTKDLLPSNRREQFFDLLIIRLRTLLFIGLILFLFSIPFITLVVVSDVMIIGAHESLTGDELNKMLNTIELFFFGLLVPCLMIFSIGLAGIFKVYIRMIWDEPVFFKEDFITGIKQNVKGNLINSFIIGLLLFACVYFRLLMINNGINTFLSALPLGVLLIIVLPVFIIFYFANVVYNHKYHINLKLSFEVYLRSSPSTLLFCLIIFAFYFYSYISLVLLKYSLIIITTLIIIPIIFLAFWENEISVFDRLININLYPEYFGKGLSKIGKNKSN